MGATSNLAEGAVGSAMSPVQDFLEEAVAREAKWNQLLSYWCDLTQNFSFSPKEFYAVVTRHLEAQQVPGLETHHVLMRESGRFSSERLYLQFRRERLVFEICGFPFGTGFFVSSRLFDRRKRAKWYHFLLLLLVVDSLAAPVVAVLPREDWVWSLIAETGAIALVWTVMRVGAAEIIPRLDTVLSDLPLVGLVYDRLFHPDTFYRQDTKNAYRLAVESAVRSAVNEMRSQKGLKPLTDAEWRPVMSDLQRR